MPGHRAFALTALLFVAAPAAAQTDAGVERTPDALTALLARMAQTQEKLQKVYHSGFTVRSVVEELEKDQSVSSRKEREVRVTYVKGVNQSKLVSATEDGKPDLDEAQRELDEQRKQREKRKESGATGDMANPFRKEEQPLYKFELRGADPKNADLLRVGFSPRGKPTTEQVTGEALVDTRRAAVVGMQVAPSKVPTFVDELKIHIEFGEETPDGPVMSKLSVQARGGIMFFEKRLRSVSVFSDYGAQKK